MNTGTRGHDDADGFAVTGTATCPSPLRRRILQGAGGVVAVGLTSAGAVTQSARASGNPAARERVAAIDVHAHYLPADYRQALIDHGVMQPDGFPVLPTWTPEAHLAMMQRLNIGTAMLSLSSPGVAFGADPAEWARRVNDSGAKVVRDHPGKFGLFATLPLPDIDASLTEIRHAFDVLQADGVILETHYEGIYLGNGHYAPVYEELNRRGAVVFVHPTSPACFEQTSLGYPRPVMEFLFDTTRAVVDLVLSGILDRYPGLRIIVAHAGAALPVLADRVAGYAELFPLGGNDPGKIDVIGTLQRLHYEIGAGSPFPRHAAALLNLVDAGQLLYGTDFPFGGVPAMEVTMQELQRTSLLNDRQLRAVLRANALELFPQLRTDT